MSKKMNLLKVLWVLGQGLFLPLVLFLDDLRVSEHYGLMIGVFVLVEALYVADAIIFLRIFRRNNGNSFED